MTTTRLSVCFAFLRRESDFVAIVVIKWLIVAVLRLGE